MNFVWHFTKNYDKLIEVRFSAWTGESEKEKQKELKPKIVREIIEELTQLNVELIELLSQYTGCEKYEKELEDIISRHESEVI